MAEQRVPAPPYTQLLLGHDHWDTVERRSNAAYAPGVFIYAQYTLDNLKQKLENVRDHTPSINDRWK